MENGHTLFIEACKDIFKKTPHINVEEAVDIYIDHFYDKLVNQDDQALLNIAFDKNLSQKKLNIFLDQWDIEAKGSSKALLLSYVMKQHPHLDFGSYSGPRLAGLLKFFRFKNLELTSHYTKIGKILNKKGIIPMVLKDDVMRYLRPDLSRIKGDIDIWVKTKEEYDIVRQASTDLGYSYEDNNHYTRLYLSDNENSTCNIHHYIEMEVKYDHSFLDKIFARAKRKKIFNVDTFLPCNEDLFFVALTDISKNLRKNQNIIGILYTLFDIRYLQDSPNFDWNIVISDISETQTFPQIDLAIKFINKVAPGILSKDIVNDKNFKKHIDRYFLENVFYCKYVHDLKYECKKLKFSKSFKSWRVFKHYCSTEIKHFFFKRIARSLFLSKLFLRLC